jgi:hypothetical protein
MTRPDAAIHNLPIVARISAVKTSVAMIVRSGRRGSARKHERKSVPRLWFSAGVAIRADHRARLTATSSG